MVRIVLVIGVPRSPANPGVVNANLTADDERWVMRIDLPSKRSFPLASSRGRPLPIAIFAKLTRWNRSADEHALPGDSIATEDQTQTNHRIAATTNDNWLAFEWRSNGPIKVERQRPRANGVLGFAHPQGSSERAVLVVPQSGPVHFGRFFSCFAFAACSCLFAFCFLLLSLSFLPPLSPIVIPHCEKA